ncbi:hypothetical protein Micbo1qcDRAFT_171165 [Microdochium bolleyi]|uniref:Uncharacterized protein n=1 Tax=Microdochium bolleyi TaxID=196109 RepID=A0A136JK08_9PEZI|nr:hypothetical protein Micbo1qcDRAFT_171165 [Microdochium bolleyi]
MARGHRQGFVTHMVAMTATVHGTVNCPEWHCFDLLLAQPSSICRSAVVAGRFCVSCRIRDTSRIDTRLTIDVRGKQNKGWRVGTKILSPTGPNRVLVEPERVKIPW